MLGTLSRARSLATNMMRSFTFVKFESEKSGCNTDSLIKRTPCAGKAPAQLRRIFRHAASREVRRASELCTNRRRFMTTPFVMA